jgi:hypothetical protein
MVAVERFEAYYKCRVRFRAERDVIGFRVSDLEQPFVSTTGFCLLREAIQIVVRRISPHPSVSGASNHTPPTTLSTKSSEAG